MRSISQMMDLIINVAKNDEQIRAVEMNGSRANPNAPIDCFQDYDIHYYVNDVSSFTKDHSWIDIFGERLMLQMHPDNDGCFMYLMLFTDGNRIDLNVVPLTHYSSEALDSESILLLDKDGFIKPFPPASDSDYHIKPPVECDYNSVCKDFWWSSQNVAKSIWRHELSYALFMYDRVMRDNFHFMIEWYIGIKTNFSVTAGKCGKYFKLYLDKRQYDMFCKTYTDSDYDNVWNAMFTMFDLFRELALEVAKHYGFTYPKKDDENMTSYLKHVRTLPDKATQIY
jgi:aminoglycoside 6-adenylyltransferase